MKREPMTTCHCPADLANRHAPACPHFKAPHDPVKNPKHYTSHPSGVECIKIARHMSYCRGAAFKYVWRAGQKGDEVEDLRKAIAFLEEEIDLLLSKNKAG